MTRMAIAARLKYFREKAGLTIYEVGEKIGKSGKTVSAWECGRGQPDADMLLTLSSVFGIAIVALPSGIITAGYMNEIEKEKSPSGTDGRTKK